MVEVACIIKCRTIEMAKTITESHHGTPLRFTKLWNKGVRVDAEFHRLFDVVEWFCAVNSRPIGAELPFGALSFWSLIREDSETRFPGTVDAHIVGQRLTG